tara:strand:+ start:176 stop:625 length:450 start_codon:yes stop_codon:yes gene_type:complete
VNSFIYEPKRSQVDRANTIGKITKCLVDLSSNATGPFKVEFSDFNEKKSTKQMRGFWRICGVLAPYLQESEGVLFDKELVADFVADECNYVSIVKGKRLRKSLKKISVKEMKALIEKLYEIGSCLGAKDYELTSEEKKAMNDYYKLNKE